ncbi:MAG: Ig-like domain repeat protein [Candidatus Hodarchaeales archaeon]
MRRYCIIILFTILTLNISGQIFNSMTNNTSIFQGRSIQRLKKDSLFMTDKNAPLSAIPSENDMAPISPSFTDFKPRFSIHQINVTPILEVSGNKANYSLTPKENIWVDDLGSDPLVIDNPHSFINQFSVTSNFVGESEITEINNSLFTRIGNTGHNETTANNTLNENILLGISAGWQIDFPIHDDFDMIQVSFKWRFDTPEGAFDDYSWVIPDEVPHDLSADYQEIRARIRHPDEDESFWLIAPITEQNPNGTVFYREGSNITLDEEWFTFNSSFHVSKVDNVDFTLELGAYLNTREYWNEYFDVWFDDILIQGINNITDSYPPQPVTLRLGRTPDVSLWEFYANLSEGLWETPIKNVTVTFYNQSGIPLNRSLQLNTSFTNEAGYNQSHWNYLQRFAFGEDISYKFLIYDEAGNYQESETQNMTIGDYEAPEITSLLNVTDSNFVRQLGNGTVIININTHDWGNATDKVILNYTLDGILQPSFNMYKNGTKFQAKLHVDYGAILEFEFLLNDTAGNSREYPGYSISSDIDIIPPNVIFDVEASTAEESRTYVKVIAEDSFGEIERVSLVVKHENGTEYRNLTLVYDNDTGEYKLGTVLKLKYAENYNMTVFVRDLGGSTNSSTSIYTVPDRVTPSLSEIETEYLDPGSLKVWVTANDDGSRINKVILQRKIDEVWTQNQTMVFSESKQQYYANIPTDWIGNEVIEFRISALDNANNENIKEYKYTTKIFVITIFGLFFTEAFLVVTIVSMFTAIKVTQRRRYRITRRKRFDIAIRRSERLAYIGEEAIFGFTAAYGQSEGVSSLLLWEPRIMGHFYQYLKEAIDKTNNNVAFIMDKNPQDLITYSDFKIEEINCSAVAFAYPVSTLPQKWLSALTLDPVPMGAGQGVLLLMLFMREKWTESSRDLQDEMADGIVELKDLILTGDTKEIILQKASEFRLFISGTLEVLDEIEADDDDDSDDIMGDFETDLLGDS